MSQFKDTGYGSVTLSGTVSQYELVTAAGARAGATGEYLGVALKNGVSGETIGVALRNKQGTMKVKAAAAFAANAVLYLAANGTVDDSGTVVIGTALEAAGAAGDIIEMLPS